MKTKITLGVGLLLFLIILLTGMGVWYVNTIKKSTDNILASNYLSVTYTQKMLDALGLSPQDEKAVADFRLNLERQKNKLPEIDMEVPILQIERNFEKLLARPNAKTIEMSIRKDIAKVMQINMDAIHTKSNQASETAKKGSIQITVFGSICFILACILFFRFPRNIVGPVSKLIEGTKEIARKNYTYRIHIQKDSEFKNLAKSFNDMSGKLEEYASMDLSKL